MKKTEFMSFMFNSDIDEDEAVKIFQTLEDANFFEPEIVFEVGDVVTNTKVTGPMVILKDVTLVGYEYYIVYNFYFRDVSVVPIGWFKNHDYTKLTHIDPKSIFKEDIKYGV